MKKIKFQVPKFMDSAIFISDLNHLDLIPVYEDFKRDTLSGIYMYTFFVNKNGKIEPKLYYSKDNPRFNRIQKFVTQTFNKYKWNAAYKKGCKKCKTDYYLQLLISFDTANSKILIYIKDIEMLNNLFEYTIPYRRLE